MSLAQRRQEEKQQRIDTIARAALKLFAEKGYSDTNMAAVAQAARLGKATLYYYFPTKEALFRFLIKRETQKFYDQAYQKVRQEHTPTRVLRTLLDFYFDHFASNPDLLRLFFPLGRSSPLLLEHDPEWQKEVESYRRPLEKYLQQIFEESKIQIASTQLLKIIWTFVIGFSVKLVQGHPKQEIKEEINLFLTLIEDNLLQQR